MKPAAIVGFAATELEHSCLLVAFLSCHSENQTTFSARFLSNVSTAVSLGEADHDTFSESVKSTITYVRGINSQSVSNVKILLSHNLAICALNCKHPNCALILIE